ncbi:Protein cwh43 [Coemansia sp. IMI 203386]|nr:Protein cwh43 [Coemansia sp. IMI 203386]
MSTQKQTKVPDRMPSGRLLVRVNGWWIPFFHTVCASIAFAGALVIGCKLHYHKIVKNSYYGYPQEWFPSVSATIGDRYPGRSFLRTFTCGGWVYVTSSDDHDIHDVMMISYMLLTLPYMLMMINVGDKSLFTHNLRKLAANKSRRKWVCSLFFGNIVPLVYYFIQHKVHRVAGAYTTYAFFEWALIVFDVMFDSLAMVEFQALDMSILPSKAEELRS